MLGEVAAVKFDAAFRGHANTRKAVLLAGAGIGYGE
jgi:hypothetical protein